jgi:nitroreductase
MACNEIELFGETMTNSVLDVIENRRSIVRFETTTLEEEKIQTILEACTCM